MKSKRHPNLVSLSGYWRTDNWLILAMELCDCTLQDRLADALDRKLLGIPPDELLNYMRDAASGLDYLNDTQVQHRDVKPANLLVLGNGVKVSDFGLAKVLEETVGSHTGMGTPGYMAPEGYRGKVAQQSDQYSLAVTYYHLRTGQLLFTGNQAEVMYAHLEGEPDLSRLLQGERAVLARALAKEPGKRWESCRMFVDELGRTQGLARVTHAPRPQPHDTLEAKYQFRQGFQCKTDYDKAIGHYDEAIRLDPNYILAFAQRGLAWFKKGNWDKTIADFSAVLKLDPNDGSAYAQRGLAWFKKDNYVKAIEDFSEALRRDPTTSSIYVVRAHAWKCIEQFEKAISDFSEAIKLDPCEASTYSNRACIWSEMKDYDRAIKDFDEAIRLNPKDSSAHFDRGEAWLKKEEYGNAIRDFDKAIRLNPSNATLYSQLAWVLATCSESSIRDGKRAIEMARNACELTNWKCGFVLQALTAAYAEAGQFDEAAYYLQKVLDDPEFAAANRERARVGLPHLLKALKQKTNPFIQETSKPFGLRSIWKWFAGG